MRNARTDEFVNLKIRLIFLPVLAILVLMRPAIAGALDRSGQSVSPLFEKDSVFEYYQGFISPNVQGQDSLNQSTGGVSRDFMLFGAAYKTDINHSNSLAIIVDQPWGADFKYVASSPLYGGTRAEANSLAISGLLEHSFSNGFSLYGGARLQEFSGKLTLNGLAFGPLAGYTMDSDKGWELGYIAGAAYAMPTYAVHFSLTYSSSIEHELKTRESLSALPTTTRITTPQSINMAFRSGIATNTLLFGSVRWVNWRDFDFSPETLGFTLATFDEDILTYTLGTAYRFSPKWSGALTLRHEPKAESSNSIFRPTNGYTGFVLSGTYTTSNQMKVTVGLSHTRPGDASAVTTGGNSVSFTDSESLALGIKLLIPYKH